MTIKQSAQPQSTPSPSIDELEHQLEQAFIENVDPVAYAYTQSLIKRLTASERAHEDDAASAKAIASAQAYLENVELSREHSRERSERLLKTLSEADHVHRVQAESLFKEYRFRQLERLLSRLESKVNRVASSALMELKQLNTDMDQSVVNLQRIEQTNSQYSIEQLLATQERQAKVATGELDSELENGPVEQLELRSMKSFRESMKHYNVDQKILRAITEEPQNPGPLNPHMIAVRGLAQMKSLSPDYLRRFVSYLETLLWLEKNMNKLSNIHNSKVK